MGCSEAQLAANRANAAKSSGPKTEAGKQRSRRNLLRHGLTGAGIVLATVDVAAIEGRFADFEAWSGGRGRRWHRFDRAAFAKRPACRPRSSSLMPSPRSTLKSTLRHADRAPPVPPGSYGARWIPGPDTTQGRPRMVPGSAWV